MRDSYSPQNGNKRTPGSHGLDPKHGSSGPSDASRSSGAEKHEPDNAKDQNGQPQRDRKDCKHRRPALSLSRLGGGFNNLALSLRCHYRLNIISSQPASGRLPQSGNAQFPTMFRRFGLGQSIGQEATSRCIGDLEQPVAMAKQPVAVNAVVRFPTWLG